MSTVQQASRAATDSRDVDKAQALAVRKAVEATEAQFAMALPKHVDVKRFMRAGYTALNTVPKLGLCTQQSVLAGLMQAAQLGLEVADVRGQCYLIPRKDSREGVMKASFQLGFRGMIDLAARSGITVDAEEIREHDEYDFALGTARFLHHKPNIHAPRGNVIAYYATAMFADDRKPAFTVMSVAEVEEHRDKFASSRDYKTKEITGPWVEHFDAMARKTVIRALLNYLPVSIELRDAAKADAIEATSVDVGNIGYGNVTALPAGMDPETGEILEATAIETGDTDPEPAA